MNGRSELSEKEEEKMKLVVDTNILISFFWGGSFTKHLLENTSFKFFSPELALEELKKYSKLIIKKTNITKKEFNNRLTKLKSIVNFIPKDEFNEFSDIAQQILQDKDDADFLALALKLKIPIWSNDSLLKDQKKVKVLTTEDLIDLLF